MLGAPHGRPLKAHLNGLHEARLPLQSDIASGALGSNQIREWPQLVLPARWRFCPV